jgi:carotene isomerase
MKILDNCVIEDEYDVIVVGAGNGGVNAAALLGKKGFKTLVIEQHYIPGGCCTAIRRKGIAFDVGAAMLFGWNPETSYKPHVYVMNEIEEPIDMIPHDAIYRMQILGDKTITFWRDFDKFFAEITAVFPHQKEQLGKLYKEFFDCYETLVQGIGCLYAPTEIDWKVLLPKVMKRMRGVIGLIRNLDKSIQDLLDKYGITDKHLIGVFDFLIATFFTTTCAETPAIMGPVLFADTHRGGCFYPSGSPQMLPNKLEKGIEKFDGQIIYRHKVDEILMEKNYAIGVRLDDGTIIKSKYVISDTTIWNLYGGLIKKEYIKPKRYEWAQHFIPTMGLIILYMGVKAEVIPKDFHSIMVWIEDLNKFDSAGGTLFAFIPSLDDPSIAPEGTHSLSILVPGSNKKWPSPSDPFYKSEEYNKWKQEEADKVIDHLEKYIPGIRKAIITLEIATPTTLERFTLKNWGCVAGPKQMLGQHMFKRPSARTEWDNVLMVGDSTTFGEGVVSTTSSAITAVNAILKDNEMPTYEDYKQNKLYVNLIKGKQRIPIPKPTETLTGPGAERLSMECNWCPDSKNKRCMNDCPAGVDVLNFIRRIEAGNYTGAARSIREMNPLGEICGTICPAEKLCQKNCYRKEYEKGPVEIPRLQAWVCKEAGKEGFSKHIAPLNGLKVAVVGAGPAGLSCAYFLARLGYSVDIYEKKSNKGGMLTSVIPTFRLPEEAIQRDLNGICLSSMNFIYGKTLGKDIKVSQLSKEYNAVFLAPGLWSG